VPIALKTATAGGGSGSPGGFVPGTGTAIKYGGEAVMLYNNLRLHDQSVYDTYWVQVVDGLFSADIRSASDPNPSDHGMTPHESFFGGKSISIEGEIRTGSVPKLRDMQQILWSTFNDLSDKPLTFLTGNVATDFFIMVRPNASPRMPERQDNFKYMRPYQISLVANDGRVLSSQERSVQDGFSSSSVGQVQCLNRGNFPARPKITIQGPVTNPVVINRSNSSILALRGVIGSGDSIIVDYRLGRKSMTMTSGAKAWQFLDIASSRTFEINRGATDTIECQSDFGSGVFVVQWRDTWW
jgi:hypothetical protein